MARSLTSALVSLLGIVALSGVSVGCGGGDTGTGGAGGTKTTSSSQGGNTGTGGSEGGTIGGGCDPACVEPQTCSVANVCIDPGTCAGDGDCEMGKVCDLPTKTCVPGGGCGAVEVKADPVSPNLLIVLDRSCSMTQAVSGSTKWEIAVKAIQTMTASFNGKIRFGLTMFPDLVAPSCEQDAIPIPVGDGNETAISDLLGAALAGNDPNFPDGPCVTNIDTAMQQASGEPAFMDPDRDSYALLITDGKQSNGCSAGGGDNGTTMTIQTMHDVQKVPTFVLGFGSQVDPAQMDIFAEAGGVPANPATPMYYDASDQASLDAALTTIANKTLGCVFKLADTPPNADEIFVFFNNVDSVARDATHMGGWDYDATSNQVTFYGQECEDLKAGTITDVDIVFGCDEPTPD